MPRHDGYDPGLPPEVPDIPEEPGVLLWGNGLADLADPLSPAALAGLHSAWAEDARTFAPWQALCNGKPARFPESWWLSRRYAGSRVVVCGSCSSSLDVARLFAGNGALLPWDSVLAVSQRAGRGQLGRAWSSPPGNIYGALSLPPVPKVFDNIVSLITGCCLVRFLRAKNIPAFLKWPNDVLVQDVKVAGVLIEEREGRCSAGMGINLVSAPAAGELRAHAGAPAGALRAVAGFTGMPLGMWCDLVEFARNCYENILAREVGDVAALVIEPLLCWLGQDVMIREADEAPWRGRILGLAANGALRVLPGGKAREKLLTSGAVRRV